MGDASDDDTGALHGGSAQSHAPLGDFEVKLIDSLVTERPVPGAVDAAVVVERRAIMCMGVATSNSILVVTFAKEQLQHHRNAVHAAIEAGSTRFRPVLMTALAMIIGMIPMALGMGDGGQENAPLGRAVIGGLLCATVATLVFVPSVFSLLHGGGSGGDAELVLGSEDDKTLA